MENATDSKSQTPEQLSKIQLASENGALQQLETLPLEAAPYPKTTLPPQDSQEQLDEVKQVSSHTESKMSGELQQTDGGTLAFVDFCKSCFGTSSREVAGDKLGIMGGATVVEMPTVLEYLENWAGRIIAKRRSEGKALNNPVLSALADGNDFVATLLHHTGKRSLEDLYACFPGDAAGRFDLPAMFGVDGGSSSSAAGFAADFTSDGFTSSYVSSPTELPPVGEDLRHRAENHLLEGDASEAHWDANGAAINIIRSSIFSGAYERTDAYPSAALLAAVAQHCASRRPTLAKSALNAITELANTHGSSRPWAEAHVFVDVLNAVKATKLVVRNAETALEAVVQLFIEDGAAEVATCDLCSAVGNSVHPKPHPQAVALGLKALARLASAISPVESNASTAVRDICGKVISSRVLSSTFAAARTVLKALDTAPTAVAPRVPSTDNRPLRSGAAKSLRQPPGSNFTHQDTKSRTPLAEGACENGAAHTLLSQQWCEVQYLLRDGPQAFNGESECEKTQRAAEDALNFLQRLENTAARMGVRKGALSRQLLPFNLETDARDQANIGGEFEIGEPEGFLPGERDEMIADALALRRLIRVKIADCADVEQAQASLQLLVAFTSGLLQAARENQQDVSALLRTL